MSKNQDRFKLINIFCATLIFLTVIGTESALAILCERTSNDYSGWSKKSNMDSWFEKNLFIEDSKLKGAPTDKSLTWVEETKSRSGRKTVLKYKLLADGKMVVVMTQGHFKSTQRYKCDRTPVEIKARLLKLEEDKKRALQEKAAAKKKAEEEAKKAAELAAKKKAEAEAKKAAELAAKKKALDEQNTEEEAKKKKAEEEAKKAAKLAAKKKAEEEAKKAAKLAAKKKAEEEAKKAAKLAAKKKAEEEAKLAKARAAAALKEATDFYKDFVMFIKSGADKDVVKSAQLFSTKPEITDKWSKTELDQYNEFKATALKNLEFNDFHRKRVQTRLTEASKIRTEKELALKSALPELLSILTEAFGSEDGNQALALKQKIEDVLQAFDQQTEETLNKTEQEVTNFLKYMEKQREKEQQKQQMRAELVQNLKSKLADLETLLTTHFGEPKGEKAASLIEKISSLTDENTEALSQLLGQVVAVLPAPETQTSDSTVISSNQTSNDTGLSSASSNQGQRNASTSTSNMPEGYEEAPPSQQFFINFVIQTKKKITEDMTSAEQKFEWIDASNALCKTEFLAGFPKMENWIGYVDSVSVKDNGDVAIDIDIDNNKNEAATLKIDPKFNRFVAGLEVGSITPWGKKGTKVRFSGFFKEGKRTENECLATFGFDSEPKLVNNAFRFDFTDIRKF